MIIKISAEFDSVDTAEFAAKEIKNKASNISSITIKPKNTNVKKPEKEKIDFIPYYVQNISINAVPVIRVTDDYYTDTAPVQQAILEVICDIKSQSIVNQTIHSFGGLKINK